MFYSYNARKLNAKMCWNTPKFKNKQHNQGNLMLEIRLNA